MNFTGYRHAFVWLLTAVLLTGCGGGDSSTPSPPPTAPLGDTVSQTVGASGGTVDAVKLGAKVHVTFPA
jgi:hypothetical protein